MIKIACDLAMS